MRLLLVAALFCGISLNAQTPSKVEYFKLQDVRLADGPFKQAQDVDLEYILALSPDRLLAPYLREAGLQPKAESYGNWENTGLDGHIGGHYLSALSMMYAATGNLEVLDRINYIVSELKKCQDNLGNGYIGGVPGGNAMWKDIAEGKINAGTFSLNDKWVPLYNIHKPFAGLRDAYLYAGNKEAKEILIKYADWAVDLVKNLSQDQINQLLISEHGGLNEVFADVAEISGDKKYLKLAHQFSDMRILNPLLSTEDKLTGLHANTQIPKVIGYERIAKLEGNDEWHNATKFFWETVVNNRSVSIGGNSVREHFHPTTDFSSMVADKEGPETCNTYNMLRLSMMLFQNSLDVNYIDYYERALYNHILSSQQPERGGFVYFTSMRPGHYRVYSQPETSFWCCVGSGLENHTKYGELIYAHTKDDLYVNLFIASKLNWKEKGLTLIQNTNFPDEASTVFKLELKKSQSFTLKVRSPKWVDGGVMKVSVNGKNIVTKVENGYISINRLWKNGDKVNVQLPMALQLEQLPDKSEYYSFVYGPIVLAAKTDTTDMVGLYAGDGRGDHIAHGKYKPLLEMPMIVSDDANFLSKVTLDKGSDLKFDTHNIINSLSQSNFELIPFFRLHDSRYAVYFQKTTPAELQNIRKKIEEDEREILRTEARTVDVVYTGEQQSESDHFVQSEKSNTGANGDARWRDATAWFSYKLKTYNEKDLTLRVKYWGADNNRNFDVSIDGHLLKTEVLDGSKGANFYYETYSIPSSVLEKTSSGTVILKFTAKDGSRAGGVYEVRLLKGE